MFDTGNLSFFHRCRRRAYHRMGKSWPSRRTRKSGLPGSRMTLFPLNAVRSCLDMAGSRPKKNWMPSFLWQALLKLERILEILSCAGSTGLRSFLTSMPVWMKQKMMLKKSSGTSWPNCRVGIRKRPAFCLRTSIYRMRPAPFMSLPSRKRLSLPSTWN